jgi:2-polyprenyl-3-methyl-5-hydroxy-6-metoxy-1,4-benzoquinol methylase
MVSSSDCKICGGSLALEFTALNRETRRPFRYGKCESCGSYQLLDVPADLGAYYSTAYYEGLQGDATTARLVDLVPVHPCGTIIEVGPARGVVLRELLSRRAFARAVAIERDPAMCAELREAGIESIQTDDPVQAMSAAPAADVIMMLHVIEHVPDPVGLLDAAARKLNRHGAIILSTPNPLSISMRICGRHWSHVDAPRHLFLLPLQAVENQLRHNGLRTAMSTTVDPVGLLMNELSWAPWAHAVAPGDRLGYYLSETTKRAARPIERRGLRGAAYTAIFTFEQNGSQADPPRRHFPSEPV